MRITPAISSRAWAVISVQKKAATKTTDERRRPPTAMQQNLSKVLVWDIFVTQRGIKAFQFPPLVSGAAGVLVGGCLGRGAGIAAAGFDGACLEQAAGFAGQRGDGGVADARRLFVGGHFPRAGPLRWRALPSRRADACWKCPPTNRSFSSIREISSMAR